MVSTKKKHRFLQTLFWNPVGAKVASAMIRAERTFDVVVRGYSLIPVSNGEDWLPSLARRDSTVLFDVGFYRGDTTAQFLELHPDATVHTFDPSRFGKESYEARYGDDQRVRFSNIALSNEAGEITFYDYANMCNSLAQRVDNPDAEFEVYTVEVQTLDQYCAANDISLIDLLKIDAEGFDLNVLEGADGMLSDGKIEIFYFEFASGWLTSKRFLWEVFDFMKGKPYKLFRLFNGFLCEVEYDISIDSCATRSGIYVGVSLDRLEKGDIPIRSYNF